MPPKATQKSATASSKSSNKGSNRKATPKQPVPVPERLKRLFASLVAQIEGGHFTNAIKTCDKILRLEPNDKDALKTKLFLLLQTEQYDAALTLIDDGDQASAKFEKSYTLYRCHREPEARVVLEEAQAQESDHRGALHLEAQLNYREGEFQTAFDLYNQLLDTAEPHSEEQSDILTNLEASQQHLDFISKGYLHALEKLPSSVSANLESTPPPVIASAVVPTITSTIADAEKGPAPVKKVRKSRVPAGVTPGVTPPPDPERWLKKSERSTFGVGKRRKGASGGASQGVTPLDAAAGPTVTNTPKASGGKGRKKK